MKRAMTRGVWLRLAGAMIFIAVSGCSIFGPKAGKFDFVVEIASALVTRKVPVDVYLIGVTPEDQNKWEKMAVNELLKNPGLMTENPLTTVVSFDGTNSPPTIAPSNATYKKWLERRLKSLVVVADYPRDTETPLNDPRRKVVSLMKGGEFAGAKQIIIHVTENGLRIEPRPRP